MVQLWPGTFNGTCIVVAAGLSFGVFGTQLHTSVTVVFSEELVLARDFALLSRELVRSTINHRSIVTPFKHNSFRSGVVRLVAVSP